MSLLLEDQCFLAMEYTEMTLSLLSLSLLYQTIFSCLNPSLVSEFSQPAMKAAHNFKYCFVDLCKFDTIMPLRGSVQVLMLAWEIARDLYNACLPHHTQPKSSPLLLHYAYILVLLLCSKIFRLSFCFSFIFVPAALLLIPLPVPVQGASTVSQSAVLLFKLNAFFFCKGKSN